MGLVLSMGACARADTGWALNDSSSCPEPSAMRLCLESEPDRGVSARIGDVELVPGECVEREGKPRRGRATVTIQDETGRADPRDVRVRAETVTTLRVTPEGAERDRHRCEAGSLLHQ